MVQLPNSLSTEGPLSFSVPNCTIPVLRASITWPPYGQSSRPCRLTQSSRRSLGSWSSRKKGKFDFALLDGLLRQAREHKLRVVFLWLAAWKNGMSSYAPLWVKTDTRRFPRVVLNGNEVEILST